MAGRKRVVIVGGGFAGLSLAKGLANGPVDVTLVDRENHHLFQPLLYQVATASLAPGSIAVPIRSVVGRNANTRVVLGDVVGADLGERRIALEDGRTFDYDYLVVAAGARTNFYGHDDWERCSSGLKDLRDAIGLRERILLAFEAAEHETDAEARRRLLSFVVIGGGPTGVEMAGAISELGRQVLASDFHHIKPDDVHVTLVEMADRVLTPFSRSLSASARGQLEELGVVVRTGEPVTRVFEGGVTIGDETLVASTVVWASGVRGAPLADRLGVRQDRSGRIVVDEHCGVPGHPHVFAIGDIACFVPGGATQPLSGVAPVAIQQGQHVARLILGELRGRGRTPFRYRDKGLMATVGRSRAVVQSGAVQMSGLLAWLAWGLIHVMYLIGFRNRFIVMFNWVWSYLTYRRGARLITSRADRAAALARGARLTPGESRDTP